MRQHLDESEHEGAEERSGGDCPLDHAPRRAMRPVGVTRAERAPDDHLPGDRDRVEDERQEDEQLEGDLVRRERVVADIGEHGTGHEERPVQRRGPDEDLATDAGERAHGLE